MSESHSTLERLKKFQDDGKGFIISEYLLSTSSLLSSMSFGAIEQEEAIDRIRNSKLKIFIKDSDGERCAYKSSVFIYNANCPDYTGRINLVHSNISWELLETDLRKEVRILRKIGFNVNYEGHFE